MIARSDESEPRKEMAYKQVMAIKLSKRTGKEIAQNYPEIVDKYRAGSTIGKIIEEYGILEEYGLTENVANHAIYCALRELASEEDLARIAREHEIEGGKITRERGIGLFSLTPVQRVQNASKAGKVGGKKTYEQGIALFSLTHEQKVEVGKKSALVQGRKLWSDEEENYLVCLCRNPKYVYGSGPHKGLSDYSKIATEFENRFGIKRSTDALKVRYYKLLELGR